MDVQVNARKCCDERMRESADKSESSQRPNEMDK